MADSTKSSDDALRDSLEMVAPGAMLREAINNILQSGTGALLCFGEKKRLAALSEGGVQLNQETTPQILYELSKMDGAILLSTDGSRIYFANRFLKPAHRTPSDETGTRHRAAQRLANQAKCMVIAISQRRASVTLYVHDRRHMLSDVPSLMNKAMQAAQTLERYMQTLEQDLMELTIREFKSVVSITDVCRIIQRAERARRFRAEIEPYLIELGEEARLLNMHVDEVMSPASEAQLVVNDYYKERADAEPQAIMQHIRNLSEDDLDTLGIISQSLGYGGNLRNIDTYLSPRGYRVLNRTKRLSQPVIHNLVTRFGSLQQVVHASRDELTEVDGIGDVLAERILTSINLLRNQLLLDERVGMA